MCFTILHRAAVDCNPLQAQCIAYGKCSVDSLYRTVIEAILPKKTQAILSMHFLRKHHMTSHQESFGVSRDTWSSGCCGPHPVQFVHPPQPLPGLRK